MKKFSKVLVFALVVIMIVGSFMGCSGEKKVQTGSKFTYWVSSLNKL